LCISSPRQLRVSRRAPEAAFPAPGPRTPTHFDLASVRYRPVLLALLVVTHWICPAHAPLARYGFLVIAAFVLQAVMLATKLEYWDEALVILLFHIVGTIMEVFKTAHGSWIYPEHSLLRIGAWRLLAGHTQLRPGDDRAPAKGGGALERATIAGCRNPGSGAVGRGRT
jgi:hypothetical protein